MTHTNSAGSASPRPRPVLPAAALDARARATRRHVWTGQLEVGRSATVLTALLGSCVGIGILWRARGVCALAHCLLPEGLKSEEMSGIREARYVSSAVPALLGALGLRRDQYDQVEIVIAGGARMLRMPGGDTAIGRRNIAAAHAQLAARGLLVAHEDVGGLEGRRFSIDCASYTWSIERLAPAEAVASRPPTAP
jgi:chemotaxis protein CheD